MTSRRPACLTVLASLLAVLGLAPGCASVETSDTPVLRRYGIRRSSLEYRVGNRSACRLPLFAVPPGSSTTSDSLFVNDRQYCTGFVFFRLDGFVQPGLHELVIAAERGDVRIPLVLGGSS